jgi:RHS repeat-associated protein
VTTTTVNYVYPDHLDTARVITQASDNRMRWRWDGADPFGVAAANQNPVNLGAFEFNPRFPGQYYDRETNLHFNYFRDYDPRVGRYVQSDPIGLAGGVNTYSYVDGQPTRAVDLEGLQITWGHGARHLPSGALNAAAQQAIASAVKPILPYTTPGGGFWGQVSVDGRTVIYRAMPLPGGQCHIGTYYYK